MEKGTDVTKLYAGEESIPVDIEYKEMVWHFEFKPITWAQKKRIQSEMMEQTVSRNGQTTMQINLDKAMVKMFQMTCTKAPAGFDITKISEEFGEILAKHIPGMETDDSPGEGEVKN